MVTITEPALEAGSDEGLMQRMQADDVGAFEELYDRYSASAFGVARAICGNSHWAEEAVQEGFVAVWRSRSRFDPLRGSVRSWLFAVIRYRSFDVMRRVRRDEDRRESGEALGFLLTLGSIEGDSEQREEAARVRSSLLKLSVAQREVVLLAYFAGLTHTEIAARLQLPTGTVKGRMRLGLKKLAAELNPSCPHPPSITRTSS